MNVYYVTQVLKQGTHVYLFQANDEAQKRLQLDTGDRKKIIPDLRKKSRRDYLKKRQSDKLDELEADIQDEMYLFGDQK